MPESLKIEITASGAALTDDFDGEVAAILRRIGDEFADGTAHTRPLRDSNGARVGTLTIH